MKRVRFSSEPQIRVFVSSPEEALLRGYYITQLKNNSFKMKLNELITKVQKIHTKMQNLEKIHNASNWKFHGLSPTTFYKTKMIKKQLDVILDLDREQIKNLHNQLEDGVLKTKICDGLA